MKRRHSPLNLSTYLDSLIFGGTTAAAGTGISWLHFKHGFKQGIRVSCEKLNLSIWMQTVEVGTFWRQAFVNVGVVALVVGVGRNGKPRSQVQLSFQLKQECRNSRCITGNITHLKLLFISVTY